MNKGLQEMNELVAVNIIRPIPAGQEQFFYVSAAAVAEVSWNPCCCVGLWVFASLGEYIMRHICMCVCIQKLKHCNKLEYG